MTTIKTYEGLKHGLKKKTLPTISQEATEIAISLDIHYLWIDSLCIIQDDVED